MGFLFRALLPALERNPIIGWILGIIGLVCFGLGLWMKHDFDQIQQKGVAIRAKITRIDDHGNSGVDANYKYYVQGRVYSGQAHFSRPEWYNQADRGALPIRYDTGNPAKSVSEGATANEAFILMTAGGAWQRFAGGCGVKTATQTEDGTLLT